MPGTDGGLVSPLVAAPSKDGLLRPSATVLGGGGLLSLTRTTALARSTLLAAEENRLLSMPIARVRRSYCPAAPGQGVIPTRAIVLTEAMGEIRHETNVAL